MSRPLALLILLALFASARSFADPGKAPELVLGEMAPPIAAAKWVRGAPVEQYESGRVYVVDFWSTWCKPCIDAMPVLLELETRYAESVTVIAMNVWEFDRQRLLDFLESHGSTLPAVVALDSVPEGMEPNEGLTAAKYLGTAEDASIPKVVIIDQAGRVAWIGSSDGIDEPLSRIVAGTWDLAAFVKSLSPDQAVAGELSGQN